VNFRSGRANSRGLKHSQTPSAFSFFGGKALPARTSVNNAAPFQRDEVTMTAPATTATQPLSARAVLLLELALAVGGFAIGTGEFAIMGLMPNVAEGLGISEP
jgi:DHA1 family inner membrane transport protein